MGDRSIAEREWTDPSALPRLPRSTARSARLVSLSNPLPLPAASSHAVVVGGGTMGADVAVVLARAGCRVTVVEPGAQARERLARHVPEQLQALGRRSLADRVSSVTGLSDVAWQAVSLVIECIPERLPDKQALFAELVGLASADCLLTSNSSSFPIRRIAEGLPGRDRMLGLHFFMPAHLVPLVEVVLGPDTDPAAATALMAFMRQCGSVPVRVGQDLPGFLANRLQHALAREAFALIDQGVASAEDVDAAVRFGFGFRFLAAGPVLQREHAGLDVHCAAAATMYPSLAANTGPARVLREAVAEGRFGMKAGAGLRGWSEAERQAERARYDALLRAGLALLSAELPQLPSLDELTPAAAPTPSGHAT